MPLKFFLAFITVMFTAVTLRSPVKTWFTVGLTGMLGWGASVFTATKNVPELVATVVGAVVIGTVAEIFARIQKQPVTVFIVSGIIPLVPGTIAYNSMLEFLQKNFSQGLFLAFRAFLISSYLAAGLAIVPLLVNNFKAIFRRKKT